jgi:hypothetical protein
MASMRFGEYEANYVLDLGDSSGPDLYSDGGICRSDSRHGGCWSGDWARVVLP